MGALLLKLSFTGLPLLTPFFFRSFRHVCRPVWTSVRMQTFEPVRFAAGPELFVLPSPSIRTRDGDGIRQKGAGYWIDGSNLTCEPPRAPLSSDHVVIYFGGDVQDAEEEMRKSREAKKFIEYSLEKTAVSLGRKFSSKTSQADVVVVRPRLLNHLTSLFKPFLFQVNLRGEATPSPHYESKTSRYIFEVLRLTHQGCTDEQLQQNLRVTLVGFSRGVSVLTQLFHEALPENPCRWQAQSLLLSPMLEAVYVLDGGSNVPPVLPVDRQIFDSLSELRKTRGLPPLPVGLFGSSYQWKCNVRPWIGEEKMRFVEIVSEVALQDAVTLQELELDEKILGEAARQKHPEGIPPDAFRLFIHFEVSRLFPVLPVHQHRAAHE
uniref:DUF676 domain-containing protein n=1 Tax=Chromera velia CCMP2878 TaxID=1169474 RepID=A0A0G4IDQ4_9ALVE|mmetsp:Transcript_44391/g.87731  ORF Transcript_44391/g.87731 Transcript_44391/m.87731 type:complete len:378 (+) Transcript_44391:113-1246(+)|eukprot:Cvel_13514.t1-p1 / transcript=Cvel_13514.t1 / gene=Cvel_13514 / organism=Chromera_velia_CCMP2878 / gene_product=hypothetical protein / transcript_product=hypothetical protein / location=Cvel_scaffold927:871-2395(+) / protein_length=377 / sequence_SO=supercontig / SO=protein_coding / is_pseudo=false